MTLDWEDDDWVKVGKPSADKGARFKTSRLFMANTARRGSGFRVNVPDGSPKTIFRMGYGERAGIGTVSRTQHRTKLRSQANYNGRDGKLGPAESFDKDGPVESVWGRVENWENDRRYFRVIINPFDHDKIRDWQRYVTECMEVLQHGSHKTFDPNGKGLHWFADGLLTDEDRAAGKSLDWVASVHRETGRAHAHVLIRGMLGQDDLHIAPEAIRQFQVIGSGVASMAHHVGIHLQHDAKAQLSFEKEVQRDARLDQREMSKLSTRMEPDLEMG